MWRGVVVQSILFPSMWILRFFLEWWWRCGAVHRVFFPSAMAPSASEKTPHRKKSWRGGVGGARERAKVEHVVFHQLHFLFDLPHPPLHPSDDGFVLSLPPPNSIAWHAPAKAWEGSMTAQKKKRKTKIAIFYHARTTLFPPCVTRERHVAAPPSLGSHLAGFLSRGKKGDGARRWKLRCSSTSHEKHVSLLLSLLMRSLLVPSW